MILSSMPLSIPASKISSTYNSVNFLQMFSKGDFTAFLNNSLEFSIALPLVFPAADPKMTLKETTASQIQ